MELDAAGRLPFGVFFDRILVDAPCSGTGTLGRHPEIRWRLRPQQLAEFHSLQSALLKSALERLAPGGRLVYSTCSLEAEENERVVEEVLRNVRGVRRVDVGEITEALKRQVGCWDGRRVDCLIRRDIFALCLACRMLMDFLRRYWRWNQRTDYRRDAECAEKG